ncbi:MAG: ferric reductase-like transmembrane domain-containing protein [Anaerolineales bacterium]|jgi:predicted ferric reductase
MAKMTVKQKKGMINALLLSITLVLGAGVAATLLLLPQIAAGQSVLVGLKQLFASDSTQIWWYVTRSAGIIAYLLLWFSTVWGLAVPSKFLNRVLAPTFTVDFHEFISLLSIGFTLLHVFVLTIDRFLPYTALQILVPFLSPYRPFWVGLGVIAFYITLLVTITFYLRGRIGMKSFRSIHMLSLLGYLGVTLHGIYAGTDSPLMSMQLLYKGTALVVAFLTIYWIGLKFVQKQEAKKKALQQRLHRHVRAHAR